MWLVDDGILTSHTGNPEYGCFISPEKTRTNFYFGSDPSMVTEPDQKGQGRLTHTLHPSTHSSNRFLLVWLRDKHE